MALGRGGLVRPQQHKQAVWPLQPSTVPTVLMPLSVTIWKAVTEGRAISITNTLCSHVEFTLTSSFGYKLWLRWQKGTDVSQNDNGQRTVLQAPTWDDTYTHASERAGAGLARANKI